MLGRAKCCLMVLGRWRIGGSRNSTNAGRVPSAESKAAAAALLRLPPPAAKGADQHGFVPIPVAYIADDQTDLFNTPQTLIFEGQKAVPLQTLVPGSLIKLGPRTCSQPIYDCLVLVKAAMPGCCCSGAVCAEVRTFFLHASLLPASGSGTWSLRVCVSRVAAVCRVGWIDAVTVQAPLTREYTAHRNTHRVGTSARVSSTRPPPLRRQVQLRVAMSERSASPGLSDGDAESRDGGDEECPVFIDRDGNMIEVLCCDYGMRR